MTFAVDLERIPHFHLLLVVSSIAGALVIILWRVREARSEVTARKILIPPLGMSTGFSMFAMPQTRIPVLWGMGAFALGALVLSWPLARTSRLSRDGDRILVKRSKAFLWIFVGLVALRLGLKSYFEEIVSPLQTGAIFFVLAFGMILRWRAGMFLEYRRLRAEAAAKAA